MKNKYIFVGDIESTNEKYNSDKTEIVLLIIKNFAGTFKVFIKPDLSEFFDYLNNYTKHNNVKIYFHNLGTFDGWFFFDYLNANFRYQKDTKLKKYSWYFIMDEYKKFYEIRVRLEDKQIIFRDSYLLLNLGVDSLGKLLNLPKLEIDYDMFNCWDLLPIKYKNKGIEYCKRDIEIVEYFLKEFNKNYSLHNYLTSSQMAYHECYKNNKLLFKKYLINQYDINVFNDFMLGYFGGFVYINKKYKNKKIKNVFSYDINSLYPYIMINKPLPFGNLSKIQKRKNDLKIIKVLINYAKWNKKGMQCLFYARGRNSERVIDVYNNKIPLIYWFNEVEFKYIKKFYDLKYEIIDYYYLRSKIGMFNKFLNYYKSKKEIAKNSIEKLFYKMPLNQFYGKWGQRPERLSYILKENILELEMSETANIKYNLIAIFITSWARLKLWKVIEDNWDNFVYCDTDSIKLINRCKNINISDDKFGDWKFENHYKYFKVIKNKFYHYELYNGKNGGAYAGLNKKAHKEINWNNFKEGQKWDAINLKRKIVKGGVILKKVKYEI